MVFDSEFRKRKIIRDDYEETASIKMIGGGGFEYTTNKHLTRSSNDDLLLQFYDNECKLVLKKGIWQSKCND